VCPGFSAYAIARLNRDGTLDRSFGGDGRVILNCPFDANDVATDVLIQPNGKIVVSGGSYDYMLSRLLPNGRLDMGFGDDEWFITDLTGDLMSLARSFDSLTEGS
jgi:uncharacterized delta-60 repeat protein